MIDYMVKEKIQSLFIYTDAGSRGNPGNAAIAFVIEDDTGNILKQHSEYIGVTTNNVAEYKAIIAALEEGSRYCRDEIFVFSDSRLIVEQSKGAFKTRKKHLKELSLELKNKEKLYKRVTYSHLSRRNPKIVRVDKLVNKELDKIKS